MEDIYKRVAIAFAIKINSIFTSETSLEETFKRHFPSLEFNRTDHWQSILLKELADVWLEHGPAVKSPPTGFDRVNILKYLYEHLDYNLFTQIYMNTQSYVGIAYAAGDAQKELDKLKEKYADNPQSPFEPKAKMLKITASEEDKEYNLDLSAVKALKIIAGFSPMNSFRVSPKGSTPAFADSKNLSMIGSGGDKYLKVLDSLKAHFLTWAPGSSPMIADYRDGMFFDPEIPYGFTSRSGGEVLQEVLFARKLMHQLFAVADITQTTNILLPRMNSVMCVTGQYNPQIKPLVEKLIQQFPQLEYHQGKRYDESGIEGPRPPTLPGSETGN